jgi:hypothetical protein
MRRLNVQFTQIEECIRLSLFAVDTLPRNPPLERGEELLLQLVKQDAVKLGKEHQRIEFALIFDWVEPDPTGEISRRHWPKAGKTWKYILHCSETIPCVPFSLEDLPLSKSYGGQTNPMYIEPQDEAVIRPYLKRGTETRALTEIASVDGLLAVIRNYDTVLRLSPARTTRVREHERRLHDPWLSDVLKRYYEHRCQVCVHDFEPRYGVPYADTRFITQLEEGGQPVSRNLLVMCPNHNGITGAARAEFDRKRMAFKFPNGLVEKLILRDHLLA